MPPISNTPNVAGQNQPAFSPAPPPVKKHKILKTILWIFLFVIIILGILTFIGYNADKNKKLDELGYQIKTVTDLKSINAIPAYAGESIPKVIVISDKNLIDQNGCFITSEKSGSRFVKNITLNNKKYCISNYSINTGNGLIYEHVDYTTTVNERSYAIGFSFQYAAVCDSQNPKEKDLCFNEVSAESFFENIVATFSVSNSNIMATKTSDPTTDASEIISTTSQATKDFKTYKNTVDNFEISFPPEYEVYVYEKNKSGFVVATSGIDFKKPESTFNGLYISLPEIISDVNSKPHSDDIMSPDFRKQYDALKKYLEIGVMSDVSLTGGVGYGSFDGYVKSNKNSYDQVVQMKGPEAAGIFKETTINGHRALIQGKSNMVYVGIYDNYKVYSLSWGPVNLSQDDIEVFKKIISTFKFSTTTITHTAASLSEKDLTTFAQCLKDKNVKLYCSFMNPKCEATTKLFRTAKSKLPYVECTAKDGKTVLKICKDNNVDYNSYPRWVQPGGFDIIAELSGDVPVPYSMISLDILAERSGCKLP